MVQRALVRDDVPVLTVHTPCAPRSCDAARRREDPLATARAVAVRCRGAAGGGGAEDDGQAREICGRDGRRGRVGEKTFSGEMNRALRARLLGARTMFGLERHCIATASTVSRVPRRGGGRARANARLARWATFLGSAMVGKKRPATTFFVNSLVLVAIEKFDGNLRWRITRRSP